MMRKCTECGKEFVRQGAGSHNKVTCSPACSRIHRSRCLSEYRARPDVKERKAQYCRLWKLRRPGLVTAGIRRQTAARRRLRARDPAFALKERYLQAEYRLKYPDRLRTYQRRFREKLRNDPVRYAVFKADARRRRRLRRLDPTAHAHDRTVNNAYRRTPEYKTRSAVRRREYMQKYCRTDGYRASRHRMRLRRRRDRETGIVMQLLTMGGKHVAVS